MNPQRTNRSHFLHVLFALSFILAGSLLAGCSHNPFVDEGLGEAQPLPINSFQAHWAAQLETKHGLVTRLYIRDTLLFGYTEDGTSYVMDRATGTILHAETIHHGDETLHTPVVFRDYIVYPTNTTLEIYNKRGDLVRSKELSYSIRSNAVGSKNTLYLGADFVGAGRLVAVDVTSEYIDHRWTLAFPNAGVKSTPAILGDIVYAAATNGDVAAVAADSREPVWTLPNGVFHTAGPIVADLAADETGVYVASTDSTLSCLNRNNGKVKWQYFAAAPLRDGPVATKDLILIKVPGVGVVAIDKLAGQYNRVPRWTAPDIAKVLSEDEKYLYVLLEDETVFALNKQTGTRAFALRRKDLATYATNLKDSMIYVVTTGNRVIAINSVLKPGVVGSLVDGPAPAPGPGPSVAAAAAR
ncbi:MAG TPA: PQQ-binding-like beta-propeller repeat protein [Tepidisphaeraceae bacterium]|nr:PQQ-binding-like beta-propeller repeat protein [Tepidisphaeraceae bacterium]